MTSTTDGGTVTIENVHGVGDQERRTLEVLYRAIAGELDLLDQAVTPDWKDIPAPPQQSEGAGPAKKGLEGFHAAFKDRTITIHDMIGADGLVAVRGEMQATQVGEWFGVPGSDIECRIAIHEFHRFDGDRVAVSWHMEDWLGWLVQVGANSLKAPGA
jgi:predicted ester cyclase